MNGRWGSFGIAAALLFAAGAALGGSPKATFEQRLREAEQRLRPRPDSRRPAVRRAARPSVSPPPRVAAPRRTRRVLARVRPRRAAPRAPAPRVAAGLRSAASSAWNFRGANIERVTWSVAPRSRRAVGSPKTGDLVLVAEPVGAPVYFYLSGGSQAPGVGQAVVKSISPPARGRLLVLAVAPQLAGRAEAFVPIRPGQITTVRFVFRPPGFPEPTASRGEGAIRAGEPGPELFPP